MCRIYTCITHVYIYTYNTHVGYTPVLYLWNMCITGVYTCITGVWITCIILYIWYKSFHCANIACKHQYFDSGTYSAFGPDYM